MNNIAPMVLEMARRTHPVIWVLHEWWDDQMIVDNLSIRNLDGLNIKTIKDAMSQATKIVFVCDGQRQLYQPSAPSTVIYVGVPQSNMKSKQPSHFDRNDNTINFLTLGNH